MPPSATHSALLGAPSSAQTVFETVYAPPGILLRMSPSQFAPGPCTPAPQRESCRYCVYGEPARANSVKGARNGRGPRMRQPTFLGSCITPQQGLSTGDTHKVFFERNSWHLGFVSSSRETGEASLFERDLICTASSADKTNRNDHLHFASHHAYSFAGGMRW